jgi:hypothetical protein
MALIQGGPVMIRLDFPSRSRKPVLVLTCIAATVAALGCAMVDIEMRQHAATGPPSQATGAGGRPIPCPECPTPIDHGSLQIHDPDLTTWMALNNTFIFPPEQEDIDEHDIYFGVLFQLGYYHEPGDMLDEILIGDQGFCVRGLGRCKAIHPDHNEVEWINIVPAGSTPDTFMKYDHLKFLYDKEGTESSCKDFDVCAESDCSDKGDPDRCLRLRKLHAEFEAKGAMTYWFGPNGYELRVEGEQHHPGQYFVFNDSVDVYVHIMETGTTECPGGGESLATSRLECKYEDVDIIQLVPLPHPNHNSYHDPPMGR